MPTLEERHRPIDPDVLTKQVQTSRPSPYLVLGMLCACFLIWLAGLLWNWGSTTLDDLHYGRPRTTQIDRYVGHESGPVPTHFVALNLAGQVSIIEIPGGTNTARLLMGPHLIGPGAELAPVSLSFPGDPQHPDLLVTVQNIQTRFHNTGLAYEPAGDDK